MSLSLGGLLLAMLGMWSQVKPPQYIIYLFVVSALFGASAAITLHFLGGRPIQPVTLMLPFLLMYVLRVPRACAEFKIGIVRDPVIVVFLFFTLYAVMCSIFAPLMMAGSTIVYLPSNDISGGGFSLSSLAFTSAHIAQIIYLLGSVIAFMCVFMLSRLHGAMHLFAKAIFVLTALNAFFGIVDLVTYYLGFSDALMFMKNARYAMVDQSMHGLRRVAGTFTETSGFSGFSIGLLSFNLCLYVAGYYRPYSGWLSAVTALLLILSTSSSAYLGMGALALVLLLLESRNLIRASLNKNVFQIGVLLLATALIFFLLWFDLVAQIFTSTVLEKLQSESGIERMGWNHQAMLNLIQTNFWGVGLGGNRASSFVMVLLSNAGVIGSLLFVAVLLFAFRGRHLGLLPYEQAIAAAAKVAAFVVLMPSLMGATSFYLGLMFYIFLALGCSTRGIEALRR